MVGGKRCLGAIRMGRSGSLCFNSIETLKLSALGRPHMIDPVLCLTISVCVCVCVGV